MRATLFDRLPVDRGFRNLFALYPGRSAGLGRSRPTWCWPARAGGPTWRARSPTALHVVYCYTPARWLYGGEHLDGLASRSARQSLLEPALGVFRRIDRRAAHRADVYIGISQNVQRRIRSTYGINAVVVPPPVDVDRFRPTPRGERLLTVSRLLPYKHVDLLVRSATRSGVGLDVVGEGPMLSFLREIAGPTVTLHGGVSDEAVGQLMERCSAVCVAAEEDFGLVAVEAQAAGKPVIAYGRGGVAGDGRGHR